MGDGPSLGCNVIDLDLKIPALKNPASKLWALICKEKYQQQQIRWLSCNSTEAESDHCSLVLRTYTMEEY